MRKKFLYLFICTIGLLFFTVSCSKNNNNVVFSFPFEIRDNKLVLDATINGVKGKYYYDTGCHYIITKHDVSNLPNVITSNSIGYINGVFYKLDYHSINEIQIGDKILSVPCLIEKSDNLIGDYDGIIGGSVFKGYFVEILFSKKRINLYLDYPKSYTNKTKMFFDDQLKPYISCNVDGKYVPFLIDIGSDGNIVFPLPLSGYIDKSKYQHILLKDRDSKAYRVNVKFFDCCFKEYTKITAYANLLNPIDYSLLYENSGNIGLDFLKNYDLLLDYRGCNNTLLYFKSVNIFNRSHKGAWYINGQKNAQFNDYGINSWTISNNIFTITSIIENSKAFSAGIQPDTIVLEINGKDPLNLSKKKLTNLLFISKEKITLVISKDLKQQTIILE